MEEEINIYDAFFGQQFLSDTVTPVVLREEVVLEDLNTETDLIELQPVKTNMPGSSGQNSSDSTSPVTNIEMEPTEQSSTDMNVETDSNEQEPGADMDQIRKFIENLSSDESPVASQQKNDGVIFHWGNSMHPRVEINNKVYSITRVSKDGNLSLRCYSSHKKVNGEITSLKYNLLLFFKDVTRKYVMQKQVLSFQAVA